MKTYIAVQLKKLDIDLLTFFRIAHYWAFKKIPDLHRDVCEYHTQSKIPMYVQRYIQHLQEKESDHVVQTM